MQVQSGQPGTRWLEGARGRVRRERESGLIARCRYGSAVSMYGAQGGAVRRQGLPKHGEPLSNRGLGIGLQGERQ